jgi:phage tail sheath gpL-like
MASITIQINNDFHKEKFDVPTGSPKKFAKTLENYFKAVGAGLEPCSVTAVTSSTALAAASGTVTVASIDADDTITINGTAITGKSSPSGEAQFDSDGSDTVVAAAIAACINAHSSFVGIVTATSSAAVVTISAAQKGVLGNCVTLASSDGTRLAVSAARLAGGTGNNAAVVSYSLGK